MDVYLYPCNMLGPFAVDGQPTRRQLETAALLLYSESVTLGRLGFHDQLDLLTPIDALQNLKSTEAGRNPETVRRYFQESEFHDLNVEELALFNYVRYCQEDAKFLSRYEPLLEEGVLRIATLADLTQQANLDAQAQGTGDAYQVMTIDSII
jgi:hypothetical protein